MKSYKPEELFDENGCLMPELAELAPKKGNRRMGSNPHANGGVLLRDLRMLDFHAHAVKCAIARCGGRLQDTLVLGNFLRDVTRLNQKERNFRVFIPMRTVSNLLGAVFEVTNRQWEGRIVENGRIPRTGRARLGFDAASEHQCE